MRTDCVYVECLMDCCFNALREGVQGIEQFMLKTEAHICSRVQQLIAAAATIDGLRYGTNMQCFAYTVVLSAMLVASWCPCTSRHSSGPQGL